MKSVTALAKKAKCKLTVCPLEESREDQWMQVRGPMGGRQEQLGSPGSRGLSLAPSWPLFLKQAGS